MGKLKKGKIILIERDKQTNTDVYYLKYKNGSTGIGHISINWDRKSYIISTPSSSFRDKEFKTKSLARKALLSHVNRD